MCQSCMLQGDVETTTVEQQESGIDTQGPRGISIASLAAIILLSLLGVGAIIGLLLGLVVWLEPQIAAL